MRMDADDAPSPDGTQYTRSAETSSDILDNRRSQLAIKDGSEELFPQVETLKGKQFVF